MWQFDRIFWSVCCCLSWIATGLLIHSTWDDFQNNAISFVMETSYLDWNTQFPSIAVCETDNQPRIVEMTDRTFGDPHDYNLDEVVKELVYYRGVSFYTIQTCGADISRSMGTEPNPECFKKNFSEYSKLVRSNCSQMFGGCRWNDKTFNCCEFFGPLETEIGTCFAINSVQTTGMPKYKMVSNKYTGTGTLYLEIKGFTSVYILGEQEVPSLSTLATDILPVTPKVHYQRFFSIKDIENQPEVRDVNVRQRKCRFSDESDFSVYRQYSYSACCVQCRKDAQIKLCGCAHHLLPNTFFGGSKISYQPTKVVVRKDLEEIVQEFIG